MTRREQRWAAESALEQLRQIEQLASELDQRDREDAYSFWRFWTPRIQEYARTLRAAGQELPEFAKRHVS